MKRRLRFQVGFSLIEVLVSMGLMAIISASLMQGFSGHMQSNTLSMERGRATAAAQIALDQYRLMDPVDMPASGEEIQDVDVGGQTYEVTVEFCADATYCTSNRVRHLRVAAARNNRVLFRVDTVYAQLR